MLILGIALAGAAGALARWGLGQAALALGTTSFPYDTLSANLIGCFLLGLVMGASERAAWMSGEMRTIIGVGFIGALTTFSTWEYETARMVRRGDPLLAAANFAVNVFFGYLVLWAGGRLAATIWR